MRLGRVITVLAGAAAMYLLDPERGQQRRIMVREQLNKAQGYAQKQMETVRQQVEPTMQRVSQQVDAFGDQVSQQAQDIVSEARRQTQEIREEVTDATLVARVYSALDGLVSQPAAVEVSADGGVVTLRGDVLAPEAQRLLDRIRAMQGVRGVQNNLTVYDQPNAMNDFPTNPSPLDM
ncbi:MAG: BON domain-containing protein [bacterium]|nr:BON domain-containing protein [bacterium]